MTGRAARLAARGRGAGAAGGPPPAGAPAITGPGVMLPPDPAVYSALERCRVFHMPAGSLDELVEDDDGGGGDDDDDDDDDDGRDAPGRRSVGCRPTSAFESASTRPPSVGGMRSDSPPPPFHGGADRVVARRVGARGDALSRRARVWAGHRGSRLGGGVDHSGDAAALG